ncbi:hypothetical protein D3C87_1505490 [compost metagenome]
MDQEQVVVRDLGLGVAFFQDGDLFGRGGVDVDDVQPGFPLQHFVREAVGLDDGAGLGGRGVGLVGRGRDGRLAGGLAVQVFHGHQAGDEAGLVGQEGDQLRQGDDGGRGDAGGGQGFQRGFVAFDRVFDQLAREFQDGGQARGGGV